jgi:hypothetical protein
MAVLARKQGGAPPLRTPEQEAADRAAYDQKVAADQAAFEASKARNSSGGFIDDLGNAVTSDTAQRIGEAAATGGLTEVPGARGLIDDALGNAKPPEGAITPAEWRAQRDRMTARYDAAGNRIDDVYGQVQQDRNDARGWGGTAPIRQVDPITGKDLSYHDVNAPTQGRTFDPGAVERYGATHVGATRDVGVGPIGAAERVTDTAIGPTALAGQTQVGRTAIDTGRADALRGQVTSNLDRLERAASGAAPSAAEGTLKAGLAASAQQALGTAAAARGSERAGARRQAIQAIGEGGFKAAQSAAALRASEMADARNALTGALTSARGQDTATATDQAHLDAASASLQAQIDAARASGNAQMLNSLLAQQASLTARTKEVNAAASNDRTMAVTNLRAGLDTGNADRAARAASQDAAADTTATATGASAANARADALAAQRTATEQNNLNRGVAVATGNADRQTASDTEAARQWIQQQQLTNAQGVDRDVAEANRGRGDFTAQTGAAQGATGQAISAANLTLNQVKAMSDAELASMAAQGSTAAAQEMARRQAQSAALGLGTKIIGGIASGGATAAVPSGGPTPYNLPAPTSADGVY